MVLEKSVWKSVYRIIDFTVVFGLHTFQSTKQTRIPGDFFRTVSNVALLTSLRAKS